MSAERPSRAKRTYWFVREVLRDPGPYARFVFADVPKALWQRRARAIVDVGGVRVRLGGHCSLRLALAIVRGRYEAGERELLRTALNDDDVVMELGTGIGVLATLCARRVGSHRMYTFEANPGLMGVARETFDLNGVAPTIENRILGATPGTREFFLEKHFWSSSTVRRSKDAQAVSVPQTPLSEAIGRCRPTFLIVDIEGGEIEVLPQIVASGVGKVLIELHPHVVGADAVARARQAFADAGYEPEVELGDGNQVLYVRRDVATRAPAGAATAPDAPTRSPHTR